MIGSLRGRILSVDGEEVVLEAGGVGYQLFCHLRTVASLAGQGDAEVTFRVHTSVSDDAIRLYGFRTPEELRLFRLLIGVERIGPKAALGILGRAEIPTLVKAINEGNAALVATVPGIGRKTAERVILELRDRMDGLLTTAQAPDGEVPALCRDASTAAIEGLVGLGYREGEAREAVAVAARQLDAEAPDGSAPLDAAALVNRALRHLDSRVGAT